MTTLVHDLLDLPEDIRKGDLVERLALADDAAKRGQAALPGLRDQHPRQGRNPSQKPLADGHGENREGRPARHPSVGDNS